MAKPKRKKAAYKVVDIVKAAHAQIGAKVGPPDKADIDAINLALENLMRRGGHAKPAKKPVKAEVPNWLAELRRMLVRQNVTIGANREWDQKAARELYVKLAELNEQQAEIARDIAQIQKYVGILAQQALAIDDAAKRARADQYRRSIPTLMANAEFDMDT